MFDDRKISMQRINFEFFRKLKGCAFFRVSSSATFHLWFGSFEEGEKGKEDAKVKKR
jgi:hypothetical protein